MIPLSMFSAYLSTTGSVWLGGLTLGTGGWAVLGVCSSGAGAGAGQGHWESLLSCTQSKSCKIQNNTQIAPQYGTVKTSEKCGTPKGCSNPDDRNFTSFGSSPLKQYLLIWQNKQWVKPELRLDHPEYQCLVPPAQRTDSSGEIPYPHFTKLFLLQQPKFFLCLLYS